MRKMTMNTDVELGSGISLAFFSNSGLLIVVAP